MVMNFPRNMFNTKAMVGLVTTFPIYCVRALGSNHILVAGGGGQAKSGVPNRLELYLMEVSDSGFKLTKVGVMDTGVEAAMNMDVHTLSADNGEFLIAIGQEGKCQLLRTKYGASVLENNELRTLDKISSILRRDSDSEKGEGSFTALQKLLNIAKLTLSFQSVATFQTDFSEVNRFCGPYQKVVRFGADAQFVVTGGADGHLRIWQLPNVKQLRDIRAHSGDIDDLDVSPDGDSIVSVGRSGGAFVWRTKDGSEWWDLKEQSDSCFLPTGYRYRFCRFLGQIFGNSPKGEYTFITCSIPSQRSAAKKDCFLTVWRLNRRSCLPLQWSTCGKEVVSCLCVSSCTRYIGLGSMEGSVSIVQSCDLSVLKTWTKTHSIFVTALDFLPSEVPPFSSFGVAMLTSQAVIISVSADNACQLHALPKRRSATLSKTLLFILLLSVFFNFFMRYLGFFLTE